MREGHLPVVAFLIRDGHSTRLSHSHGHGPGERFPLVSLADVMSAVDEARKEPNPKAALEYLFTLCSCAYEE